MKKIESLNEGQTLALSEYRDKWIKIGLSTEPANRPEAEKAIRELYKLAGLKAPNKIVWCGSPLSQGLVRAIILDKDLIKNIGDSVWASVRASVWASVRASVWDSVGDSVWASVGASVGDSVGASVGDSVGASVRASVWDSVRASVWASVGASVWDSVGDSVRDSVWDSVRASVWASVGDSVGDSVWASVRASVWDSVRASVWDSVRASVWDSVGASVGDSVGASCYGQHDANWLGFYEYFREQLGLKSQTEKIIGLIDQAKNAGWFIPHAEICWVCERHNILCRDQQGRLHNESGPALAYPDGWKIFALHGVRMKKEYVMTPAEKLDSTEILKEENAEVRRELIRKVGVEMMLSHLPNSLLDKQGDYELLKIDFPGLIENTRFLKMLNPSIGVWHLEGVERECNTVEQAINWRAGRFGKVNWKPEVLT